MDKMRKEFESWFYSEIDGNGVLEDLCWQAWQASRAVLVVKLPENVNDMDSAPMLYDSIIEQLTALGVRYE